MPRPPAWTAAVRGTDGLHGRQTRSRATSRRDESTGPDAGPDRPPTEGGAGTHEVGITEELAEEEQEKEEGG